MRAGSSSSPRYRSYLYWYEVRALAPLARQALSPDPHVAEASARLLQLYADYVGLDARLVGLVVDAARTGCPVPVRARNSVVRMTLEDV